VLTDCNHLGKLHFWLPRHYHLRKTCNTKLVVDFLHFLVVTHLLKSDKQGRSYDRWSTAHKWKNPEYSFWFELTTMLQNSANWIQCKIRRNVQCKSDREFQDLSRKYKYALIRPTVQELRSLQVGVLLEISFQNRLSYLDKFRLYTYFQWRTRRAMNTKVLENFVIFLTVRKLRILVPNKKVTACWI
jgi:hypothetical protein